MKIPKYQIILLSAILLFIWGNSLLSPELSGALSDAVKELINTILGREPGGDPIGGFGIRKLAHFLEFTALGLAFTPVIRNCFSTLQAQLPYLVIGGLFFPLSDETIQMFTRRGPAVKDVWIDCCGYTFGVLISFSVLLLWRKRQENRHKNSHPSA